MKITKNVKKTFDIRYVDCQFSIGNLQQCNINGVSSTAQTVKHLPFLKFNHSAINWSPRIILDSGRIVCWPKGIKATINFEVRAHTCYYLTSNNECAFVEEHQIPFYLQLDLIDNSEALNFTVNEEGYIENWPDVEQIVKQLL